MDFRLLANARRANSNGISARCGSARSAVRDSASVEEEMWHLRAMHQLTLELESEKQRGVELRREYDAVMMELLVAAHSEPPGLFLLS